MIIYLKLLFFFLLFISIVIIITKSNKNFSIVFF